MSSFVCCINDTYFLSIQHRVLHMNIEVIGALSISTATTGTITVRIPLSMDPNKAILQRYNGDEY